MDPIPSIHVAPTTQRQAELGRFGTAFRATAAKMANGVAASVGLATPFAPEGMVLAAATGSAPKTSVPVPGAASSSGSDEGDLLEATRALQLQGQSFNLQYLQLQESMQQESREFQALSNVMKVKHDSAKAAINNIH
jgi:hypothetical protein